MAPWPLERVRCSWDALRCRSLGCGPVSLSAERVRCYWPLGGYETTKRAEEKPSLCTQTLDHRRRAPLLPPYAVKPCSAAGMVEPAAFRFS